MFCVQCGNQISSQGRFCSLCGKEHNVRVVDDSLEPAALLQEEIQLNTVSDQLKTTFIQASEKINAMVGERGPIEVNLRDVFSAVFKKHKKEEGELLFIAGTSITTPIESEISASWPKPWLFSRVFTMFAVTYILLYICIFTFDNLHAIPGLILVGSFTVPFSLLIFFWEMNAPRNISIYDTAKMFFVGGTASLVFALILYSIIPVYGLDYQGAILVGAIEEIGKLVVIAYFIQKLNSKFILNGLLVGATIGAGFAAFESAGYALNYGLAFNEEAMVSIIFLRAWTAIGTHVVWSAIVGAALVYVKGKDPLIKEHLFSTKFLKLFAVPVVLHSIWNMPLYSLNEFYILNFILIICAWLFIFTFINAGLKQISRQYSIDDAIS
ncbi:PrsW family intramembrane metalloprotease [Planococcus sp. CAU13]|uniref:PrsW family intramembrane metalloprotease n=1 Tax=Planococcus sp. CAU13 TaxID=1541197 RepID=UPI00052FFA06|nr:PrsW family glutamic-type intramembrane protease [Planococcus sp. CAU13]